MCSYVAIHICVCIEQDSSRKNFGWIIQYKDLMSKTLGWICSSLISYCGKFVLQSVFITHEPDSSSTLSQQQYKHQHRKGCPVILTNIWPDLPKGVLYMHSFKAHFSLPSVSYISRPTAHVFNAAKGWTVCFYSVLFLKPVWHPQVLRWPLNDPIFPWQVDSQL